MKKKTIKKTLLATLRKKQLSPEQLFENAGVQEQDARDVLSSLIDDGTVVVGRGWKLRLAENAPAIRPSVTSPRNSNGLLRSVTVQNSARKLTVNPGIEEEAHLWVSQDAGVLSLRLKDSSGTTTIGISKEQAVKLCMFLMHAVEEASEQKG